MGIEKRWRSEGWLTVRIVSSSCKYFRACNKEFFLFEKKIVKSNKLLVLRELLLMLLLLLFLEKL